MMLLKRGFQKFVAITVATAGFALSANENPRAKALEQWNNSSFMPSSFTELVNDQNCHVEARGYWACYSALYAILEFLTEGKQVVTFSNEPQPYHGKLVKAFGPLEIRELIQDKIPTYSTHKENFELFMSEKQFKARIESRYKSHPIPINEATAYLIAQAKPEELKVLNVVGANTFIQNVEDSHFAILLSSYFGSLKSGKRGAETVGIGALLANQNTKVSFVKVYNNSPASEAGIRAGDIILSLDEQPLDTDNVEAVASRIRGTENTPVTIEVQRGSQKKTFKIVRRKFEMQNMMTSIRTSSSGEKALYITIEDFVENDLCSKFTHTISAAIKERNINNIIVDLRNNGGGMMQIALCMVGSLAENGERLLSIWDKKTQIFKEDYLTDYNGVYWNPRRSNFVNLEQSFGLLSSILAAKNWLTTSAQPIALYDEPTDNPNILKATRLAGLMNGKKIVVLVNQGSASASEIFSGTVQDLGLGAVIGTRTFGKGCGQELLDVTDDVQLKKTTFRFHFKSGHSNQKVGIEPDQVVFYNSEDKENDKYILREAQIAPYSPSAVPFSGVLNTDIKRRLQNCAPLKSALAAQDETADNQLDAALEAVTCL